MTNHHIILDITHLRFNEAYLHEESKKYMIVE